VKGSNQGTGNTTINYYMPNGVFAYDVIVGGDCSNYPATTSCPSSIPTSPGIGYDARTIGPDMAKLNAATSAAVVAP
jgi:hypothetical protein